METFSSLQTPAGQRALKCLLLCKVCRGLNNVTVQLVKIASRAYDTFVWSSYVCICMQRFLLTLIVAPTCLHSCQKHGSSTTPIMEIEQADTFIP